MNNRLLVDSEPSTETLPAGGWPTGRPAARLLAQRSVDRPETTDQASSNQAASDQARPSSGSSAAAAARDGGDAQADGACGLERVGRADSGYRGGRRRRPASTLPGGLIQLTKPRILVMILVTTLVAFWAAAPEQLLSWVLLHTLCGTALMAASASVLNQWLERDRDAQMPRTSYRPLPTGCVRPWQAFCFGWLLAMLGTVQLGSLVGMVPAALGLATWGLYVWIYTPLKVVSSINTAVGTLPGALPVLIGWSAAGGAWTDPIGWLLFGLLVIWQFPHFMAIAWLFRDQYHAAGFQMLTRVDPSGRLAGWHAVIGAGLLFPISWGLTQSGTGAGTLAVSLLGLGVVAHQFVRSVAFFRLPDDLSARRLLRSSLLVLPAMLVLALVAQWLR